MKSTIVRHAVALIVAILVLIASGVHYGQSKTDQRELHGLCLSPAQVEEAGARLTEVGLPFHVNPSGDGLRVAADLRGQAILRLSERGIPRVDSKWRRPLHPSERRERRDLEIVRDLRELAQEIPGLEDVTCHFVIPPEANYFAEPYKTPLCAVVMLAIKPGHSVGQEQLNVLRHFLTLSSPELEARWVKFYDREGRELSDSGPPPLPYENADSATTARALAQVAEKALRTSLATNTTVEVRFGSDEADEAPSHDLRVTVLGLKAPQKQLASKILLPLLQSSMEQSPQLIFPPDIDGRLLHALQETLGHQPPWQKTQSKLVGQLLSLVSLLALLWAGVSIMRGHKVEARN